MKNNYKGIIFVFLFLLISIIVEKLIGNVLNLEILTIGIILGMIYSNFFTVKKSYKPGINFCLKKLLKFGIVLLGFKLDFYLVKNAGPKTFFSVIFIITMALILGFYLSKIMKVDQKTGVLIGVGSSICGASAVVAMGPVIKAKEKDTVISVSIVSVLGAIGVLLYSFLGNIINLTDAQFGAFCGISLHGVAHALAAAGLRGEASLEIGTFVKMLRVLMLVPVSLVLSNIYKEKDAKVKFPTYLKYFLLAVLVNSIFNIDTSIISILSKLSSYSILMAMISMGLMVDFKDIKDKGLKSIGLGVIIFIFTSITGFIISCKIMN